MAVRTIASGDYEEVVVSDEALVTFTDEQLERGARAMIEERNGVPLEQIDTNAMERAAILANTITDLEVALKAMRGG